MRRVHKAFRRYHDPENWPLLRDARRQMGRADLIGSGKKHLIPGFQPAVTGLRHRESWLIQKTVQQKLKLRTTRSPGKVIK